MSDYGVVQRSGAFLRYGDVILPVDRIESIQIVEKCPDRYELIALAGPGMDGKHYLAILETKGQAEVELDLIQAALAGGLQ